MASKWERGIGIATGILVLGSVILLLFTLATGLNTNGIVTGQQNAQARQECATSYAAVDSVAAAKLEIAFGQLSSAQYGSPAYQRATRAVAVATVERSRFTALRLRTNEFCDPNRPGGPQNAPPIDPPEVTTSHRAG